MYKASSGLSVQITGGTFSTTNNVNGCQIGDRLYFADGSTGLSYYDGSGITTAGITAAPTGIKQLISYNQRLYCNSSSNLDRIYYGGPMGSDGSATDTGVFTVGTTAGYRGLGKGKEVIGFAKLSTSLYTFCKDSIYKLDPTTSGTPATLDHTATVISNSIGCRSSRSIDNVENDVFFLGSTVYALGEVANYITIRTTNISSRVSPIFDSMDQTYVSNAAGMYYDKENIYLLAISLSAGHNDTVIGYSLPYKAWFKWSGLKVNSWCDFLDTTDSKHLYFGSDDSTSSNVFEAYQGNNDDGTAISAFYTTKEYDLAEFNIEKIFQNFNMQFGSVSGTIKVYFYVDNELADTAVFTVGTITSCDGIGTGIIGRFIVGTEGNYTTSGLVTLSNNEWRWHTFSASPNGTTFKFKYENNELNQIFEIKQTSVGYIALPYYKRNPLREI